MWIRLVFQRLKVNTAYVRRPWSATWPPDSSALCISARSDLPDPAVLTPNRRNKTLAQFGALNTYFKIKPCRKEGPYESLVLKFKLNVLVSGLTLRECVSCAFCIWVSSSIRSFSRWTAWEDWRRSLSSCRVDNNRSLWAVSWNTRKSKEIGLGLWLRTIFDDISNPCKFRLWEKTKLAFWAWSSLLMPTGNISFAN